MKTRETMKSVMCMLLVAAIGLSSCKKKDDAKPAPTTNKDSADMGQTSVITINVLANDSYSGNPVIRVGDDNNAFGNSVSTKYGTLVVNSDKTITFTSRTNFYGTATLKYNVQDESGMNSTGSIVVKRGTDAQATTYQIINKYVASEVLFCYAINGDSSRIYSNDYENYTIYYGNFASNNFSLFSNNVVVPEIGYNTFNILTDGSISSLANNGGSTVILQMVGEFTASAKKRDGSGQYMTVSGYTLKYGTDVLDFTTQID